MEVNILNSEGLVTGKEELSFIKEEKVNPHLLHEVVRAYLANQRKGTHSSKTRSMVAGSMRKPWKQKHTGRARAGTATSPLWKGGGIIFGPHPRSYRIDLPKKKIKKALSQVLAEKARKGELIVSEKPDLQTPKTKKIVEWMEKLSLPENSLLVVEQMEKNLTLSARNLPDFSLMDWRSIHPYHLLKAEKIIFTPEAAKQLNGNG